jgi:hypothetical protein
LITKKEKLYKDMKAFKLRGRDWYRDKRWTMDKERATLRKREGSKLLDKRSTQVGGASS